MIYNAANDVLDWNHGHSGTPPENYPVMSAFLDQITHLTPIVLGPEINPPVTVAAASARVDTMVRTYNNMTYLFAVRVSELSPADGSMAGSADIVTITIDGVGSGTAAVYDDAAADRSLSVSSGSQTDTFASGEVHIYEITEQ